MLDLINVGLSVSSILSGAAAFLLGFYIVKWEEGKSAAALNRFKSLVFSLVIPSIIIGVFSIYLLIASMTADTQSVYLLVSTAATLIPPVAFLIIVLKK